ncbi:enoyl-CoA hydratase-related protein [Porphyromonas macacae]|uniref:enoyl-CoA hydratase-related protein n=1 Tax=Porphyromonas macacae TaxID=28115 RepID=UPI0035A06570
MEKNSYKYIRISREEPGIGILTIDREEALNALSSELLGELLYALYGLQADKALRVLIITGAGRSFVAGADIAEMSAMTAAEGKAFGRRGAEVFRFIEQMTVPVIAAVNGFALGGGCELAMACDIRIASEKAKFGQPEVGLGIIPGFSGTQRMPRLIGEGMAKELIYSARIVKADEALTIGLVNRVVPAEELMEQTLLLARQIAAQSPVAVCFAKEAVNNGMQTDIDTAIAYENNLFGLCFASEEQKEGMDAFLNKRKPDF